MDEGQRYRLDLQARRVASATARQVHRDHGAPMFVEDGSHARALEGLSNRRGRLNEEQPMPAAQRAAPSLQESVETYGVQERDVVEVHHDGGGRFLLASPD